MKLKCIGGPMDGQYQIVDEDFRVGDLTKVMENKNFRIVDFEESVVACRKGETPEALTIKYHMYRIAVLYFSKDDRFCFLAYRELSNKEAMLHQFGK